MYVFLTLKVEKSLFI